MEVPFLRGFLRYSQHTYLDGTTDYHYAASDATTSLWHDAKSAAKLAAQHGTDTLASIQLDISMLNAPKYLDVDPVDIAGILGEISGFWLVVLLMFSLLFYRHQVADPQVEMRQFKKWRCLCKRTAGRPDFS